MWLAFSITAAAMWGLSYVLMDKFLKDFSAAHVLIANAIAAAALGTTTLLFQGKLTELKTVVSNGGTTAALLAIAVTGVAGNLAALFAIQRSNTVLASMVEISYPLFVCLFAWWMIGSRPSLSALTGGLLVLAGIAVIKAGAAS